MKKGQEKKPCGAAIKLPEWCTETCTCELREGHRGDHLGRVQHGTATLVTIRAGDAELEEYSTSYRACSASYGGAMRTCDREPGHGGRHRALGRMSEPGEWGVVYEWAGSGRTGAMMLPIGNVAVQIRGKVLTDTERSKKELQRLTREADALQCLAVGDGPAGARYRCSLDRGHDDTHQAPLLGGKGIATFDANGDKITVAKVETRSPIAKCKAKVKTSLGEATCMLPGHSEGLHYAKLGKHPNTKIVTWSDAKNAREHAACCRLVVSAESPPWRALGEIACQRPLHRGEHRAVVVARGAAQLATWEHANHPPTIGPMDLDPLAPDPSVCGERPTKKSSQREGCLHEKGHDDAHGNTYKTWSNRPSKSDAPPDDKAERVYQMIAAKPGMIALEIGRRHRAQIAKLEQAKRIEWRDEGWHPAATAVTAADEGLDDDERDWDPEEDGLRTGAERDFARRMREDREAHAAALDAPAPNSPPMITRTGETITCRGRVYRVHPAARLFPTPEKQYREIVDLIRTEGQKHEVELLDDTGEVIDGCNRLRACEELGIEPRTKTIHVAPGGHFQYVKAVNLARRHLDESLRAVAAGDLATLELGANQHTGGSANLPTLTQAQAADLLGVSTRSVTDAVRVRNLGAPEVVEAVREGRLKVSAGAELVKLDKPEQRKLVEQVTKGNGEVKASKVRALVKQEQKRAVVAKINEGRVPSIGTLTSGFGVALSDPAWPYDNSDQHEGTRGHIPYPGQPVEEIVRLHVVDLPARMAEDAVLFLCYTNAFLPVVAEIAKGGAWTYRTQITIVKSRTGMGTWPRGRTEHVAIFSRGTPTHTLNEVSTWLADRVIEMPREHSRKPEELYQLIEKHCGGPRVELYSRYARDGWTAWGAEADGAPAKGKRSKIHTATDARVAAQGGT